MITRKWVFFLIIAYYYLGENTAHGSKILAIFPTETKSHYIMYESIIKELASKGHEITVASQFPMHSRTSPVEFIDLRNIVELPMYDLEFLKNMTPMDGVIDIIDYNVDICIKALSMPCIRNLLNNKYDLLITELFGCDCFLALGHKLNIPIIGIISSVPLPWTTPMIGYYENPSYVPSYFQHFSQKMSLSQRLINTVFSIYASLIYELTSNRVIQPYVEELMGPMPPMKSLSRNISLILANSHFSINHVKPTLPQLIEIAGVHIPKNVPPIPEDFENFYKKSKDGVIVFSLGSFSPAETFGKGQMNAILKVLGSLKQNIIWKINGTGLSDMPPNIKLYEWLPQLSLLCDPRTKLFIAHGGLLGLQEAMYCGIPVLGIPLFADQYTNLHVIQEKGAGILLYYDDINEERLASNINKLLNEKSYQMNSKKLSSLFRDRPQTPLETAIYWIEYVLKHGGAPHLRSPIIDLAWYQYTLLDVFTIILVVLFVICFVLVYLLKKMIKYCSKKNIVGTSDKKTK